MAVADLEKQISWVIEELGIHECDGPPRAAFTVGSASDVVSDIEGPTQYSYEAFRWRSSDEDGARAAIISHLKTLPRGCYLVWRIRPKIEAVTEGLVVDPVTETNVEELNMRRPAHFVAYFRYTIVVPQDFDAVQNWQRRGCR